MSAMTGGAAAAPPADSCPTNADPGKLANEGKDLRKSGKNAEAYGKLSCAYQTLQSYTVAANLGLTELALAKYADACNHVSKALREWPRDDLKKLEAMKVVEAALGEAKQHVLAITVHVDHEGAKVEVDGVDRGRSNLPDPVCVEPGEHTVTARIEGFATATTTVRGGAGAVTTAELRIAPSNAPEPPPPLVPTPGDKAEAPAASPESSSGRAFHPALLSIPLVAAGVGIGTGTYLRSVTYGHLGKLIDNQYFYVTHGFGNDVACDTSDLVVCQFIRNNKAGFDSSSLGAEASFGAAAGMLAVTGIMLAVEVRNDDFTRRPFHPWWFAAPLGVGTIALATAAGLHAVSVKKAAQMADNAVGIYRRSGAVGCDDPASAADCQANLGTANASDAAGNAALGMAIVGGVATVSTGIMVGTYFGLGKPSEGVERKAAALPFAIAPRASTTERGVNILGAW